MQHSGRNQHFSMNDDRRIRNRQRLG